RVSIQDHNMRIGSDYLQILRSAVPFLSISLKSSQLIKEIEADLSYLGEDQKADLERIKWQLGRYNTAYWRQLLFMPEVHGDMQPANVLRNSDNVNLIDLGNMVNARGAAFAPLWLLFYTYKGDAKRATRVLFKMGAFPPGVEKREIQAKVQSLMDANDLKKRTYAGLTYKHILFPTGRFVTRVLTYPFRKIGAKISKGFKERVSSAAAEDLDSRAETLAEQGKTEGDQQAGEQSVSEEGSARPGSADAQTTAPETSEAESQSETVAANTRRSKAKSRQAKKSSNGGGKALVKSLISEILKSPYLWLKYKTLGARARIDISRAGLNDPRFEGTDWINELAKESFEGVATIEAASVAISEDPSAVPTCSYYLKNKAQ
ncbi:MAG: hypothetical protein AAF202_11945, partial [Pseudomonadota bacterium]